MTITRERLEAALDLSNRTIELMERIDSILPNVLEANYTIREALQTLIDAKTAPEQGKVRELITRQNSAIETLIKFYLAGEPSKTAKDIQLSIKNEGNRISYAIEEKTFRETAPTEIYCGCGDLQSHAIRSTNPTGEKRMTKAEYEDLRRQWQNEMSGTTVPLSFDAWIELRDVK